MERMRGVDAGFLYMETPTTHMHTVKVAILQRPGGFSFDRFVDLVMPRLAPLSAFNRRVLRVPLDLNHPLWIRDRELDPGRHIFHCVVPSPGGMHELEELIGRIVSLPLDRSIPLWELHVCEGLEGGRVAVVAKLHHAIADGAAANNLLGHAAAAVPADQTPGELEETPSRAQLVVDALRDAVLQAFTLPALLSRTIGRLLKVVRVARRSDVASPKPVLDTPRTSFNGPLGSRRNFATATLALDDLKAVKNAHDVTLNDVLLAVVGGALRRWLDQRGEDPGRSLVAAVPVGVDPPGGPPRLVGNRVSNMFTTLATAIDDPVDRLRTVSQVTRQAKLVQQTLGREMFVEWVQFIPPGPFNLLTGVYGRVRAASWHPPAINLVVSNVAGPREVLRLGDFELVDLFSVGPLTEGVGINVTAWSYQGRMNVSVLSCPDLVSDLHPLIAQLQPALEELKSTATATRKEVAGA